MSETARSSRYAAALKPSSALAATARWSASRVSSFAAWATFASSARFAPAGIGWFIAKLNASRGGNAGGDEPRVGRRRGRW